MGEDRVEPTPDEEQEKQGRHDRDVDALVHRTRAVIERTRRVIEEAKETLRRGTARREDDGGAA